MLNQNDADVMRAEHLRKELRTRNLRVLQFGRRHEDNSVVLILTPDQAMHLAEYIRTNGFTNTDSHEGNEDG